MKLWNKLFNIGRGPAKPQTAAEPKSDPPKPPKKTEKELANERGEPYITVISMDIDPEDINSGAFELDWNDKFVANLVRAGYQKDPKDTDADIVDRWFQNVCRNVVLETWEQEQAMNPQVRYTRSRDIGGGRREHS